MTNALTLARWALLAPISWQSPRLRRERYAGLLYTGALLHEGLRAAEVLGKHFNDLPQYRNGFAQLQRDPSVQRLRREFLKPLRDKVSFHFDADVITEGLANFEYQEYVAASGRGTHAAAIYFDLADDVVTHFLLGRSKSDAAFLARMEEFAVGTSELFSRFIVASHRLVPTVLKTLGWKRHPNSRRSRRRRSSSARAP